MTTVTHHSIHAHLVDAQTETLATPRRPYSFAARLLFSSMDLLYGRKASLPKFVVLELVARVPYQTWEHAAYLAITRHAGETRLARRIYERVCRAREQQDNEQWHLFILEDILEEDGVRLNWFRYRLVPQFIALVYYFVAFAMYLISPRWSHRLNADFEDHAEHEYMAYVAAHLELEAAWCTCSVADDYGHFGSRGDVIRQIALDERAHKQESVDQLETLPTSPRRVAIAGAVARARRGRCHHLVRLTQCGPGISRTFVARVISASSPSRVASTTARERASWAVAGSAARRAAAASSTSTSHSSRSSSSRERVMNNARRRNLIAST